MTLDAKVSGLQGLVNGDYDQTDEQAFYLIGDLSTLKEPKECGCRPKLSPGNLRVTKSVESVLDRYPREGVVNIVLAVMLKVWMRLG